MDDSWRLKIRVTCLGLGQLTVGFGIMARAISNAEHSVWCLPQFAFGGAIVTQGFLHLTAAWNNIGAADPPALANGPARVGIRRVPGVEDLDAGGLVLHRVSPPIVDGKDDFAEADVDIEGEVDLANNLGPANVGHGAIPQIIVNEADQEIDAGEDDLPIDLVQAGQANNAGGSGQGNDAGESGQSNNAGGSGQSKIAGESCQVNNADESCEVRNNGEEQAVNALNEAAPAKDEVEAADMSNNKRKEDSANEIDAVGRANDKSGVNHEVPLNIVEKCVDEEVFADELECEIELPRSAAGLALDIPSLKFIDSSESDCESCQSSY